MGVRDRLRRARTRYAAIARRTTKAATPIPMPIFAADVRPLVDVLGWGKELCIAVAVARDEVDVGVFEEEEEVVVAEDIVEVVVELVLVVVDEDVEVDTIPSSVETMAPSPSRTMPRLSAQHVGSLSQQKLPSEQVVTRGRKPVPVTVYAM